MGKGSDVMESQKSAVRSFTVDQMPPSISCRWQNGAILKGWSCSTMMESMMSFPSKTASFAHVFPMSIVSFIKHKFVYRVQNY